MNPERIYICQKHNVLWSSEHKSKHKGCKQRSKEVRRIWRLPVRPGRSGAYWAITDAEELNEPNEWVRIQIVEGNPAWKRGWVIEAEDQTEAEDQPLLGWNTNRTA